MTGINEDHPLITLALFAYNQERYIRDAVAGALAQTYSPLQIMLSDDCSTDRTFEIMQEMVADYTGPHEILLNRNEENLGIGGHVNKVFGLVSGRWLVMAAGDDVSYPGRCKCIAETIGRFPDAVAICSAWDTIDADGCQLPTKLPLHIVQGGSDRLDDQSWIEKFKRNKSIGIPGCTAAWRYSLFASFSAIGKDVVAEDVVLGFRAYLTGDVIYLPEVLVRYRQHDQNINGTMAVDTEVAIRRQYQFAARMRTTYAQCVSDVDSMRNVIPSDVFHNVMSLIIVQKKITETKAEWWDIPWRYRLSRFISLYRYPNRMSIKNWAMMLLPWQFYVASCKYGKYIRRFNNTKEKK